MLNGERYIDFLLPFVIIVSITLIIIGDPLHDVGLIIFGAVVSLGTTYWIGERKLRRERKNLARSLYIELADRASRTCFDNEKPWQAFRSALHSSSENWDTFRLRKFLPFTPIIYNSSVGKLSVLDGGAPLALVQFYYRLASLQRDIENKASELEQRHKILSPNELTFIARRFHQTLSPGLNALLALAPMVTDWEQIEFKAIAEYDAQRSDCSPEKSLRSRLEALIAEDGKP